VVAMVAAGSELSYDAHSIVYEKLMVAVLRSLREDE
jgi:hypothetical protein